MDCSTAIGIENTSKRLKASGIHGCACDDLVYHENARETLTRFAEWNLLIRTKC